MKDRLQAEPSPRAFWQCPGFHPVHAVGAHRTAVALERAVGIGG